MSAQAGTQRVRTDPYRRQYVLERTALYVALILGAILSFFPFYWMLAGSFKPSYELLRLPPTLWPHEWTLAHYSLILSTMGIGRALLNSVVVVAGRVILVVLIALMTGYSLAKLRFPGRKLLFAVVLGLMMIPAQLLLIPLFLLTERYGLLDTYAGLIVPGAINSFSIFLMRQAFLGVPNDYIDAAIVDGAGHARILFRIALPMVQPMVLTLALINGFWAWNDFLWPFIVIVRDEMSTLPVMLARYTRLVMRAGGGSTRIGPVMAAAALTALPIMIVFLIMQRRFVEALTMAGLKG